MCRRSLPVNLILLLAAGVLVVGVIGALIVVLPLTGSGDPSPACFGRCHR